MKGAVPFRVICIWRAVQRGVGNVFVEYCGKITVFFMNACYNEGMEEEIGMLAFYRLPG